ncbi:peptidylprolyl isomerase [Cellulophaga baltica]|uniref:peptidylprolyl isomerase n=1 Tax=Cellulophaga TaxID=104264 RepID=UPI001C074727|nr:MULTISPECIES: peptidylprolyl isomerase [Cellulophaga]MBU2994915.1 peptidylprolyl isomerase [Cellulophaga baltica]MDO6766309.1 peptidylprolyl isomerase [Cellulophaga sp. 1_MG-2023]
MIRYKFSVSVLIAFVALLSCKDTSSKKNQNQPTTNSSVKNEKDSIFAVAEEEKEFILDEENAIPFFFEYEKTLKEDKVKITTNLGSFTIQLYDDVPYHRANFVYLTKKGYFDNTMFHRVVKDFVIQGGNSDNVETGKKRQKIGHYLLPPDTRKGHRHNRGVISMPSSEIDNPHKLASPFEFFIVVTKPGSYHLDKDYTAFGQVIGGMDVVDKINKQPVDGRDWPLQNVYILKAEAF